MYYHAVQNTKVKTEDSEYMFLSIQISAVVQSRSIQLRNKVCATSLARATSNTYQEMPGYI